MRAHDVGPRRHFEAWAADRYDAVWFDKPAVFHWLGRPRLGPTIVDIDDLEDEKAMQWAGSGAAIRAGGARRLAPRPGQRWPRPLSTPTGGATCNVRWRPRSIGSWCAPTPTPDRSGFPNAVVVPNSYPRPDAGRRSLPGAQVGDPPAVLLQGTLTYAPNMDAVDWLMGRVAPRLWAEWPQVQFRLVGNPAPGVQRWNRPPVGHRGREGAGHGTGAGAGRPGRRPPAGGQRHPDQDPRVVRPPDSGGVHHPGGRGTGGRGRGPPAGGRRPGDFAAACGRLLADHGLRNRLVDAAEGLYLERYQWAAAKDRIGQIVAQVAGR